jgi:NAD-dependent dihydropyrimidine dehydrogenase PreA subunit
MKMGFHNLTPYSVWALPVPPENPNPRGREKQKNIMEEKLVFDPMKCVDCRICELECSFANEGGFNPRYSRIKILVDLETRINTVRLSGNCTLCHLCETCCPTGALCFSAEFPRSLSDAGGVLLVKRGGSCR